MNNLKGFSAVSEKEMLEVNGGRQWTKDHFTNVYIDLGISLFNSLVKNIPVDTRQKKKKAKEGKSAGEGLVMIHS